MAIIISFFSKKFLFLILIVLSGINIHLRRPVLDSALNKKMIYQCVVIGEDQKDERIRLRLHIKKAIINRDTMSISVYADHYTYQKDDYLGKTLTIKGRLICRPMPHQSNLLIGSIINKDYSLSFAGRIFNAVYGYINRVIKHSLNPDYIPIAQGLILGGSSRLSPELKNVFARAGVLHILAVSGLHTGFILAILGTIFMPIPISPKIKFFLIIVLLLFYAGITGFRPSVIRASIMAFLFGLSFILQRQVDAVHIVNMSALILLLLNPFMLFDIGAQLSFGAVYGIVYLLPKLKDAVLKNIKISILKPILWSMATSFSAQVFVSPFLIYYFNQLPTLAVFSNLLIVPIASLIIYLLFFLIFISLISAPALNLISFFLNHIIWLLEKIAGFFSSIPFSSLSINLSPILLFLFFFIFYRKTRKVAIYSIFIIAIISSLCPLIPVSSIKIANNTALITLPNKENILIYKGRTNLLENMEIKEVDYLFAQKKLIRYKKEFIPLPGDFHIKKIRIGDFSIALEDEVAIYWRQNKYILPEEGYENRIKNIILGDRGVYQFLSLKDSWLDGFLTDIKTGFGYFIAYF